MSALVWVKTQESASKEVAFLPAETVSVDGDFMEVKLAASGEGLTKGDVHRMPSSDIRPRFEQEGDATAADNTALVHLNDASILSNLEARHKQDHIYTYTASVLLAVNPYKKIAGLYGKAQCKLYHGRHIGALPPHPYAIADATYRTLVRDNVNQALLISGESGAGKTETAKIVMNYLAFASGSASEHASNIQSRVLQAQPILESLGNAATLRNSNSSRFGKYNRVYFDSKGTLVDAGIQTYLLESSRVVVHGDRERTYHVFYEMLQGLSEDKLAAFHLGKSKQYRLMHNAGDLAQGFEDSDKQNFERLCSALETVGQTKETIDGNLRILAGLLHLGDIPKQEAESEMATWATEDESDTRTVEVNEDSIKFAAELLGMDPDELCGVLKRRKISIPGRDSMHEVPRNPMQFRQALHSLIKALYKRVFEQTVGHINNSFAELRPEKTTGEDSWRNIGILDIYGFERLQRNSFEQLCINLANERLQQYFVENVLVAEQQLYGREGLPWTGLALPDSTPVVNCISQVFKTLDDFSHRLAKGFGEVQQVSDERFCERVLKESAGDAQRKDVLKPLKVSAKDARNLTGPRTGMHEVFVITHYAGTVDYNTKGWLDKNNDRLLLECEDLITNSTFDPVKALGEEDQKQPFRSISTKYSKDLEALLTTLGEASLHYIRCFKPNAVQKPDVWNGQLVLDQLVQCGTIELVKIMHDGFPNRCAFDELVNRFKALLPEKFQRYGMRTFVEALMLAYEVPRSQWALGMTRLFLKAGQLKALEDMREGGVMPNPDNLDRIVKQIIRKRWSRACTAVRLCVWLPKFLHKIHVERAATRVTAVARVTGRLAPRLEAAKQRVAQRRLAARRRLCGVFRTVCFLNRAWREVREKRKQRVSKALYLGSFILSRTKPWLARARAYLADAEVRKQREEEQRLRELNKRMQEEEERLRLEAEKRREEEEKRAQAESAKRRQEEEDRLKAEAENRKQEELAAETKRQEEEAERVRREEERLAELEEQQRQNEKKAEEERLEAERICEEDRLKMEAERKQFAETLEAEKLQMVQNFETERIRMAEEMAQEKEAMRQQMAEEAEAMKRRMLEDSEAERQAMSAEWAKSKQDLELQRHEIEEMQKEARRLSVSARSGTNSEGMLSARRAGEDASTVDSASVMSASVLSTVQETVKQAAAEAYAVAAASEAWELAQPLQEKSIATEKQLQEHPPQPVKPRRRSVATEAMAEWFQSTKDASTTKGNSSAEACQDSAEKPSRRTRTSIGTPGSTDNKPLVNQRKYMAELRHLLKADLEGEMSSPAPSRSKRSVAQK